MRTKNEARQLYLVYKEIGLQKTAERYGLTKDAAWGVIYRERKNEGKISSGVHVAEAEELRRRAVKHARYHKGYEWAEDFGSFCVLRLYENGKASSLKHLFIDYKRATFGNMRTLKGTAQAKASFQTGELTTISPHLEPVELSLTPKVFEALSDLRLTTHERACFLLHCYFGLTLKEIGLCMDVTESRVSQILVGVEVKLGGSVSIEKD